jgi:hypothetical protein
MLSLPQDMTLLCDQDRFWLGPASGPRFPAEFFAWLKPPETLELPDRGLRLTWKRSNASATDGFRVSEDLVGSLVARSPLPGDCVRRSSSAQPVALSDLFASAQWSKRARARAVVVESGNQVVWVPGLVRACAEGSLCDSSAITPNRGWLLVLERLSPCLGSC